MPTPPSINGMIVFYLNPRYLLINNHNLKEYPVNSNLIDPYFRHTLIWLGIPVVIALFWIRSGRSPLLWLSLGFAWLEAVRCQLCKSWVVVYDDFKKDFPDAVRITRGEIGAFGD